MKNKQIITDFIFLALLIFIFFFLIGFLMLQSPFVDEAIYLHLANEISKNPSLNNLLFPMSKGLSPLFIYFTAISIRVFHNPFFSGRIMSLFIHLISTIMLFFYFRKKRLTAFLPVFFFFFNPFSWMYSQMAMLETTMMFFSILFVLQAEKTVAKQSNSNVLLLSFLFFLILLSKYTGVFIVIYFLYFSVLKKQYKLIFKFFFFFLILFLASFPITADLFQTLAMHSDQSKILNFSMIKNNFRLIFIWLKDYFYIIPLSIFFILIFLRRKLHEIKACIFLILSIVLILGFASTNFFPRYLYLIVLPFSIILSATKNKISLILIIILAAFYLPTDYKIMFDLKNAKIAKEDVWQHYVDWTSGRTILLQLKNLPLGAKICSNEYNFYYQIVSDSFFTNRHILFEKLKGKNNCVFMSPK